MTRTTRVNVHAQLSNAGDNLSASKKRFGIDNFSFFFNDVLSLFFLFFFLCRGEMRGEARKRAAMDRKMVEMRSSVSQTRMRARPDGRTNGWTGKETIQETMRVPSACSANRNS